MNSIQNKKTKPSCLLKSGRSELSGLIHVIFQTTHECIWSTRIIEQKSFRKSYLVCRFNILYLQIFCSLIYISHYFKPKILFYYVKQYRFILPRNFCILFWGEWVRNGASNNLSHTIKREKNSIANSTIICYAAFILYTCMCINIHITSWRSILISMRWNTWKPPDQSCTDLHCFNYCITLQSELANIDIHVLSPLAIINWLKQKHWKSSGYSNSRQKRGWFQ